MNILHVITSLVRGGAENHLVTLAIEQAKQKISVTIAYLKSKPYWLETLDKNHVRVVSLGMRYYGDFQPIIKLRSLINDLQPDIIHAHLPPGEIYTRIALLGTSSKKLPLIISKHNEGHFYNGFGHRYIGSLVAKRSNHIIAISNAVKTNQCINYLDYPSEKVKTIYYGIDPTPYQNICDEKIKKIRSLWSVTDETYLIGTVARLVPQKCLHNLLEGFSLYLQTATKPTKLVVVGVGALEADLKNQAIELGIQEKVIWAGFREDITVVMNALDVFALTSIYEGLGLVLLEAMSAGKPVVASNISAIPEVVINGTTGILFTPKNSVGLAEAFKYLENEKIRLHLGDRGRERVKINFTLDKMIDKTLAVYNACI
ncbi:glycosyltransferase [Nostoc sp. UHCC 0870]|uniref:glycosyltransferase n=1 Tax=Nostoc sp. UHCC 0870 TaxID=2914041 RepID=UPI001EDFC0AD|nr:glycosyltransferase [Nostoc sp. UHCC 0870]UKO98446.1 glycosyltransferase [Nostoc sp. UHCC 0870]